MYFANFLRWNSNSRQVYPVEYVHALLLPLNFNSKFKIVWNIRCWNFAVTKLGRQIHRFALKSKYASNGNKKKRQAAFNFNHAFTPVWHHARNHIKYAEVGSLGESYCDPYLFQNFRMLLSSHISYKIIIIHNNNSASDQNN